MSLNIVDTLAGFPLSLHQSEAVESSTSFRSRGLDIVQILALHVLEVHRQWRLPEHHEHHALLVRDIRQAAVLVRPIVLAYECSHWRG